MTSFVAGYLADGQLGSSVADIFVSPTSTTTYVKRFSLYNTDSVERTIQLYLQKTGGTQRKWKRYVLGGDEMVEVFEAGDCVHLSAGDKIRGSCSTDSVIDYYMTGIKEA